MEMSKKTKMTAILAIVLMATSVMVIAVPVQAQTTEGLGQHGGAPGGVGSAIPGPMPTGVRIDQIISTEEAHMSFRPNPVGVGQPILVNIWCTPSTNNQRFFNNYTVYFIKPDGTMDSVGPLNAYQGDATSWFEYYPDQVGEWQLKFVFPGNYFPNGTYNKGYLSDYAGPEAPSGGTGQDLGACYYVPASTEWQSLTVQNDIVASWPPAPLPTDYWTRPVSFANREWWPILGDWPGDGWQGGGPTWDALYPDTNPYYADEYNFHPWVTAPNTDHIVWKRQDAGIAGLTGGPAGIYGTLANPGGPSVIYSGRAYGTWTVSRYNGTPVSCAACYDIRTGELYYAIPIAEGGHTPTRVAYYPPQESTTIVGEIAQVAWQVELIDISGTNLYKINPYTGAVTTISISPLTNTGSANLYYSQYGGMSITVQDLGAALGANRYRLINWTTRGNGNLASRILTNTSYSADGQDTFFRTGVTNSTDRFSSGRQIDWNSGVWCQANSFEFLNTTGTYEAVILTGYNILTGQRLWQRTLQVPEYSRSDFITDHGKIAVLTIFGVWQAYNLVDGSPAWTSERMESPWGANSFGAYAVCSAYGMFYRFSYDGIYAFNWTNGKIVWHYVSESENPYETPYWENGVDMYSFNSGGWVADGKMYVANSEHTTSWPITRGWQLHCINITDGTGIWKICGDPTPYAAADGYLVAGSSETGYNYVFGKGKSATTVTAPDVVMPEGNGIVIKGTVLDMSPAQTGAACVSLDSMTTQMQYLHFQRPIDGLYHNETLTGVPVLLTAIGDDGSVTDIGTVTTDGYYGTFTKAWTPPSEGTYKIVASFAGNEAYGSSSGATGVSVGPAAEVTPPPEIPTPVDNTMLLYGILIAVIIAIVLALVAIFWKH
jgi:hypothetical protein